jgi:hypothetical protein
MGMGAKVFWLAGPWNGRLGIVPRPRGAEWLDDETRAWRAAGIDIVVSLLEPDEEAELAHQARPHLQRPGVEGARAVVGSWCCHPWKIPSGMSAETT